MAARLPRKHFATPFVITIASVASATTAACVVTSSSGRPTETVVDHRGQPENGGGGGSTIVVAPGDGSGSGSGSGSTIISNPPRPQGSGSGGAVSSGGTTAGSGTTAAPGKPDSKPTETAGTAAGGTTPRTPAPGKPDSKPTETAGTTVAPGASAERSWTIIKDGKACKAALRVACPTGAICNPPPPVAYACPSGLSFDRPVVVTQAAGASECTTPDGKKTVKVACPTR